MSDKPVLSKCVSVSHYKEELFKWYESELSKANKEIETLKEDNKKLKNKNTHLCLESYIARKNPVAFGADYSASYISQLSKARQEIEELKESKNKIHEAYKNIEAKKLEMKVDFNRQLEELKKEKQALENHRPEGDFQCVNCDGHGVVGVDRGDHYSCTKCCGKGFINISQLQKQTIEEFKIYFMNGLSNIPKRKPLEIFDTFLGNLEPTKECE